MQLNRLKLSIVASMMLVGANALAEDYISLQYMSYDEDSGKTSIHSPHIEFNKDFGVDYTLNLTYVHDSVTGASPIYYDTTSGATPKLSTGVVLQNDIRYDYVNYEDDRNAYGATLTKRFANRDELSIGLNYSKENDYKSKEISAEYLHYLDPSKNRSISFGISSQQNDILVYCSPASKVCDGSSGASQTVKDLKVINLEVGFTQIIDATSLIKSSLFYINEDGYLSNPYMTVVRDYNTNPKIAEDSKPNIRKAFGATLQYSKALNDAISLHGSYRYYNDDWDISSHTIDTQIFYEFNPKLTIGLGGRYYTQTKAKFYSKRRDYFTNEKYASSDPRMRDFESVNYSLSLDYKITDKLSINGSINYYEQFDFFDANYYNIGFKYKF